MRGLAFLRCLVVLTLLGLSISWSGRAHAYAWMIKHGFSKCGSCHTDPAGGETLTKLGRVESEYLLSAGGEAAGLPSDTAQFLWGAIDEPTDLRLGGSYRHMLLYTAPTNEIRSTLVQFPMQLDLYGSGRIGRVVIGASLGVARGIEGSANVRGAQINHEAGEGFIVLSRSHYIGLWLQEDTLLRVGRLNLPFGVRIPEHVMWAREATRTDRESDQQHGVSLTYTGGRWRSDAMIVIGNFQVNPDRFRERGYVVSAEYLVKPTLAIGGSSLLTRAQEDAFSRRKNSVRYAHGLNTRWGAATELALLGEFDVTKESGRKLGYTGFLQADYEPLRGVHLMLTGEVLDQGSFERADVAPVRGAGRARYGGWASLDWFPTTHLELRLDGVSRQDDVFQAQLQLHLYF